MDIQRSLVDVQNLAASWRKMLWVLAIASVTSGLAIILGPGNSRTSAGYKLLESISVPYVLFAILLCIGGVLVVIHRVAWIGHLLSAISLLFWSLLIIFISLVTKQPSSLSVAFWSLGLGGVHAVILYGRVYRHTFHSKLNKGTGGLPTGGPPSSK